MIPLQTKTLGTWEVMVPLHPYFKEVGTYWESWNSNFPEPVYVVGVPVLFTNVGDVEDDPEFAIDVITFGTDGLEQRGNLTMDIWDNSIYDHGAVPAGETIEVLYYFVYTGPGEYALFFDKWDTNETFEVPMELAL